MILKISLTTIQYTIFIRIVTNYDFFFQEFDGDGETYDEEAQDDPEMLSIVEEESEIDDSRIANDEETKENCENSSNSNHKGNGLSNDRMDELKTQFSELVSFNSSPHSNEDVSTYFFDIF